jgi:hypothetical protein
MMHDELLGMISRFAQRPLPALEGRHVYLWHGDWNLLRPAIPSGVSVQIDLHQLATTLAHTPRSRREAAEQLRRAIDKAIKAHFLPTRQQIFVITGCDLLSRYQIPVRPFFDIASEQRMIILVVPADETHFRPTSMLPDYVSLDPVAQYQYLQAAVGEAATIHVTEDMP